MDELARVSICIESWDPGSVDTKPHLGRSVLDSLIHSNPVLFFTCRFEGLRFLGLVLNLWVLGFRVKGCRVLFFTCGFEAQGLVKFPMKHCPHCRSHRVGEMLPDEALVANGLFVPRDHGLRELQGNRGRLLFMGGGGSTSRG